MSQKVWRCAVSGWKAERHVLLGTPATIAEKVQELSIGVNRRLFYVVVEGDGPGKVYQYEHKDDDRYEIKVAETPSAETFNHAAERVMFQNKGQSCVGRAIQAMPEFEVLRFQSLGEHRVRPAHAFSELLPLRTKGEHTLSGSQDLFLRASFNVLC